MLKNPESSRFMGSLGDYIQANRFYETGSHIMKQVYYRYFNTNLIELSQRQKLVNLCKCKSFSFSLKFTISVHPGKVIMTLRYLWSYMCTHTSRMFSFQALKFIECECSIIFQVLWIQSKGKFNINMYFLVFVAETCNSLM